MKTATEPLRVMFIQTSMPVGGAEVLLVDLVRGMDPARFSPEIVCLKDPGPLGEAVAQDVPVHSKLSRGKYDAAVLARLARLLQHRRADAVVTVGAGDKMFWGRLAARLAGTPVIASALHSTGWPDGVGRLNRLLTPITDAFIAVSPAHGAHLEEGEGFPRDKVHVIPNGVDTNRFQPLPLRGQVRGALGISTAAPVVGILAALRPEKNHELFLQAAARVLQATPDARFLVIGDGPCRVDLESLSGQLGVGHAVQFLGSRSDVPELLSAIDVLALTSHNEANPVSILEALSCATPVVATDVGGVGQTVIPGRTGELVAPGDAAQFAATLTRMLDDPLASRLLGEQGRRFVVENWSLQGMVRGYERLLADVYARKTGDSSRVAASPAEPKAAVRHS